MNIWSFILKGRLDGLAKLLADIVGRNFEAFRFSHTGWQQFVVALQYDPCRHLMMRLFATAGRSGGVRIVHAGRGGEVAVFEVSNGSRLAFQSLDEQRLKVEITFSDLDNDLRQAVLSRLDYYRITADQPRTRVRGVLVGRRQEPAFIIEAGIQGVRMLEDLELGQVSKYTREIAPKTERGFQFLLTWLKARAASSVN